MTNKKKDIFGLDPVIDKDQVFYDKIKEWSDDMVINEMLFHAYSSHNIIDFLDQWIDKLFEPYGKEYKAVWKKEKFIGGVIGQNRSIYRHIKEMIHGAKECEAEFLRRDLSKRCGTRGRAAGKS